MKKRNILTRFIDWCPMTPGDKIPQKKNTSIDILKKQTRNNNKQYLASGDMNNSLHQICPFCKKLVSEEKTVCPHCNNVLTSENKLCPFCSEQVSDEDTICPNCEKLLIYETSKQVTKKRNAVLFPLGFLLLFTMTFYGLLSWSGVELGILNGLFFVVWLIGFVLYGSYIGKGDKDFWFGK